MNEVVRFRQKISVNEPSCLVFKSSMTKNRTFLHCVFTSKETCVFAGVFFYLAELRENYSTEFC